jgi:hypothetical protein
VTAEVAPGHPTQIPQANRRFARRGLAASILITDH